MTAQRSWFVTCSPQRHVPHSSTKTRHILMSRIQEERALCCKYTQLHNKRQPSPSSQRDQQVVFVALRVCADTVSCSSADATLQCACFLLFRRCSQLHWRTDWLTTLWHWKYEFVGGEQTFDHDSLSWHKKINLTSYWVLMMHADFKQNILYFSYTAPHFILSRAHFTSCARSAFLVWPY